MFYSTTWAARRSTRAAVADTRLATACLCFALDLEQCRIPEIKPYVHGQGNISGSVRGAVRAGLNEKHEEFERICTEIVDWYQAGLIGQTALHQAVQDLLCLGYNLRQSNVPVPRHACPKWVLRYSGAGGHAVRMVWRCPTTFGLPSVTGDVDGEAGSRRQALDVRRKLELERALVTGAVTSKDSLVKDVSTN